VNEEQRKVMASGRGFIAALDQSGGSTPKALSLYGISHDAYDSDEQMFGFVGLGRRLVRSFGRHSGRRNGDESRTAVVFATPLFNEIYCSTA